MTRQNHKKGFRLLRSSSEAIAPKTRRGFNLIEAAIVLGVVGLVIGGIWIAASAVRENMKVSETTSGVLVISKNVQNLVSTRDAAAMTDGYYFSEALRYANVFPQNWIHGSSVVNPFNGNVEVINDDGFFYIYLSDIPEDACIKVISTVSGAVGRAGSILKETGILDTSVFWSQFPVTPEQAAPACQSNASTIFFSFYYTRIN